MTTEIKEYFSNSILGDIVRLGRLNRFKRRWRSVNKHNDTIPVNEFDPQLVKVGNFSYGELNVVTFHKSAHLYIGNFVSIAPKVTFLLEAEHSIKNFSTFPFKVKCLSSLKSEAHSKGDILIGDDVWIGYGSTLLSGIRIGQGAVIAAGAVVSSDVAPYAIVGGIPAKIIKMRFSEMMIEKLLQFDYSQMTKEMVLRNVEKFYNPLKKTEQIKELIETLSE